MPAVCAMSRHSCPDISLPTLKVMPSFRVPLLSGAIALLWLPTAARAQNGSTAVTARVQALPLSVVDVTRTAVPGELVVRVAGCGAGAMTVDARTASGTIRTARLPLPATGGCTTRDVRIHLSEPSTTASEFLVSLEQSDRLLAPSFSQFVVPASVARHGSRSSLAY